MKIKFPAIVNPTFGRGHILNTQRRRHIHCSVMATVGQFLYPGSGIEVLEEEYDENFEPTQKGNY